jgi:micrococcal nuclease
MKTHSRLTCFVLLTLALFLAAPLWAWQDRGQVLQIAQVKPAEPSSPLEQQTVIYRGNVGSQVFHKPGCKYYDCKGCTASFKSRDEAVKAGYKPCKVCKP